MQKQITAIITCLAFSSVLQAMQPTHPKPSHYDILTIGNRHFTSEDFEEDYWKEALLKTVSEDHCTIINLRGNDVDYIPTYMRHLPGIQEIWTDGDDHILNLSGYDLTNKELENKQWKKKIAKIMQGKKITTINLRHNKLTAIPSFLSSLPNVKEIWVEDNDITIKIPKVGEERGFAENLAQNSEVLEKMSALFDTPQQKHSDNNHEIVEIEEPSILFSTSDDISFTKTKLKTGTVFVAKLKKRNCWGEYKHYILIGSTLLSMAGPAILYVLKFFLCG